MPRVGLKRAHSRVADGRVGVASCAYHLPKASYILAFGVADQGGRCLPQPVRLRRNGLLRRLQERRRVDPAALLGDPGHQVPQRAGVGAWRCAAYRPRPPQAYSKYAEDDRRECNDADSCIPRDSLADLPDEDDTNGDGIIGGPPVLVDTHIFEFDTFNQQPVVDAGNNLYSFLDGGPRTVTLDGTLEADDGRPVVAAPVWSVVSALSPFEDVPDGGEASVIPSASYSFVDPGLWNAQFQMSLEGDYVLQLVGDDTELQSVPQTMIVFLRDTACDATVIFPGYEALSGDFDQNCVVDLNDFASLASAWLSENAMDDTTEYIPE